ncbi:MAG TPA: ATP-binding protein [Candidatus Nitrosotenuis sp.]|nr:ATP-binding protein [Candidatus Nitrosotenuis sp.]
MRWVAPGLAPRPARALSEALERACMKAGGARGWVLWQERAESLELLACLGPEAPSRRTLRGSVARRSGWLEPDQVRPLCPFADSRPAQIWPLPEGALVIEGARPLPPRLLEEMAQILELVSRTREVELLRRRVSLLAGEMAAALRPLPVPPGPPALGAWQRQAAEALATDAVGESMTAMAERAARLLDHHFCAVILRQGQRCRLWGGEPLERVLGRDFPLRRLGWIGRRVLGKGEEFHSHRPDRLAASPEGAGRGLAALGLTSLRAFPLQVQGRILGALVLGDRRLRQPSPAEIETARLLARQSAVLLENALWAARARLEADLSRSVLASMGDGVMTLDWEKRITSFNPAAEAITGWSAAQAVGRSCQEVMQAEYVLPGGTCATCGENCPLLVLLADPALMERGLSVEGRIRHRQGENRYVSSTYSVVAHRGDLLGAVVVFRDITRKKVLEEMKSDYAISLSHDLKTPLTAIKGYAVSLLRLGEKVDEATRREALEVINSEIDHITRMFDNLIHLARFEAGRHTSHLEPLEVLPAVQRVISLYQVSTRRHRLESEVEPGLRIRADRDQLDQVLRNLVSNAIKYSPEGGRVVIRAERQGPWAEVRVSDPGPGIPAHLMPLLFQRFSRLDMPRTYRVQGSGLGLYITRNLVEAMGGTVGVESREGEGSTFWFRLPLPDGNLPDAPPGPGHPESA